MKPGVAPLVGCLLAATALASGAAGGVLAVGTDLAGTSAIPIVDLQGRRFSLQERILAPAGEARATLLVFWATWCQPCLREIPEVNAIQEFYADRGLQVMGLGLKEGGDTADRLAGAAHRFGVKYPVMFDSEGAAQNAFGVSVLPMSVLIDRRGVIRWKGPTLPHDINARIRAALETPEDRGAR
ncbi:MAG: TlpA disulfide reductase family protein [Acidobacteriota bacterium]